MGDGTASRAAGVRLKKVRGSGLRRVITGRTLLLFGPVKPLENLGFSQRNFEAARNGSRKFRLYCDASAADFGATLEQPQKDNTVRPRVYLSRTVLPNEHGWAPIEKEAGCIVWSIKRLRQYLFLISFDIYTDHLPLTSLLCVSVSNARVQRWVGFLTAYNYRIIRRKGAAHGNADMLSRLCQPATEADAQGSCSITNPEDHAVYFVGASGMWPRSILPSAFNVFIETVFAKQRLGVGGLLSAPDYSYDKSRNEYVYHGHEDVEKCTPHSSFKLALVM